MRGLRDVLPGIDNPAERQASGLPLRGLPDGLDDREDRIDPSLGTHRRELLNAIRRLRGGFPGLGGLRRALLALGGLLERLSLQPIALREEFPASLFGLALG